MRRIAFCVCLTMGCLCNQGASAETRKLPVIADLGICAHRGEVHLNTGGNPRIRVKGNEHYYLFQFDSGPISDWRITSATLHVKLAGGNLREVAFCTVPVPWVEGTAVNKPQDGSTCSTHPRYPSKGWPGLGLPGVGQADGTMQSATFNSPYMLWRPAKPKPVGDGWLDIPINPALVRAVAAGWSHGLVMSDEKGQTRENHDLFTREQSNARPYLVVKGETLPRPATLPVGPDCRAETYPQAAGFDGGAIRILPGSGNGREAIGHRIILRRNVGERADRGEPVRNVVTFGRAPEGREDVAPPWVVFEDLEPGAEYLIEVRSLHDRYALKGPMKVVAASAALDRPEAPAVGDIPTIPAVGGQAAGGWRVELRPATELVPPDARPLPDNAKLPVPAVPRNAWAGLQIVLFPPAGNEGPYEVWCNGLSLVSPRHMVPRLPETRFFRTHYVRKEDRRVAEVLVPLVDRENRRRHELDWPKDRPNGQTCQPLFLDVWVPKDATPGRYMGFIKVSGIRGELDRRVEIEVLPVALPDEFAIAGDMNTYGSPAGTMGVRTSDPRAFIEMERKYYRLAHAHRMTLNVLPYSQSGRINWRAAPTLVGEGDELRLDFAEWDERYGPLLSGKAFSTEQGYVGPGVGMPIRHMYLPFHENWPAKLADHFRPWPPPKGYDAFRKWSANLPPLEQCLGPLPDAKPSVHAHRTETYALTWQTGLCRMTGHLMAGRGPRTRFQVYLNNKHYFRDRRRSAGRGISLWLLDEPMFPDDFRALEYFGRIVRPVKLWASVLHVGPVEIDFRIDISRPARQRQWLDGLVNLNVCADQLHSRRRFIAHRKREFGERYWNYAMPPSFGDDNLPWAVWPVRSLCWGATGTLPWQTVGSDGDLKKADPTALMVPGRKFGLDEPVPSLRMKAWRYGLETAELLRMLAAERRWNDLQLRAFVGQVCGLDGWQDGMDPRPDGDIVTFDGMTWEKLETLRRAIAGALRLPVRVSGPRRNSARRTARLRPPGRRCASRPRRAGRPCSPGSAASAIRSPGRGGTSTGPARRRTPPPAGHESGFAAASQTTPRRSRGPARALWP